MPLSTSSMISVIASAPCLSASTTRSIIWPTEAVLRAETKLIKPLQNEHSLYALDRLLEEHQMDLENDHLTDVEALEDMNKKLDKLNVFVRDLNVRKNRILDNRKERLQGYRGSLGVPTGSLRATTNWSYS